MDAAWYSANEMTPVSKQYREYAEYSVAQSKGVFLKDKEHHEMVFSSPPKVKALSCLHPPRWAVTRWQTSCGSSLASTINRKPEKDGRH